MSGGKETSSCAAALLLCIVLALPAATGVAGKIETCALRCTRKVSRGKTEAKCTLSGDTQNRNCSCRQLLHISQNVSSLDLSGNKLTEVPTWIFSCFVNLTALSLAENNIRNIQSGTFAALEKLTFMSLSFNDLRDWKVNPTNELRGLRYLNVTGNEHWLPSEQLLQLSNLTIVEGVRLSQYCQDCSLFSPPNGLSIDLSWHDEIQLGRASAFIKLGFWPTCLLTDDVCKTGQLVLPLLTSVVDVTTKSSFALYATGSVALLVNIAVVVFVVLHKSLRNDLAVRLLLHVAVCDALIALDSILLARFNPAKMSIKHTLDQLQGNNDVSDLSAIHKGIEKLTHIMGPILTCAVVSHIFGSGISMLDKFFKIVFAINPDLRIGRKTAEASLVFSWSLSVTYAVLPVFGIQGMTYGDGLWSTSLPIDQSTKDEGSWKHTIGFAFGLQIALVILQLASFLLYVPIFIVAKKSGANVGVKREAAIARKIALLLCTNLIFFTLPILVSVGRVAVVKDVMSDLNLDSWSLTFAEFQWSTFFLQIFPVLCLSINSLLDPFLYAVRHPKVKQRLRPLLSRCWAATRECFGTLMQNLRCHATNVQPNNEVEMQVGTIPESASLPEEGNDEVQSQPVAPQCPSHANELTKESEDTRF